jgi:metallo-beta-lactamase family protein
MAKLTFHGAAETVTGSKYLLESGKARVLIDCGIFQGLKELRLRNWDKLPFEASSVDCVVLTHAHIDHTGYLPRLVKLGFSGPIFCTSATQDLTELLLLDSARNQEEEADYANQAGYSKHRPALPLFDARDVSKTVQRLKAVPPQEWHKAAGPIWYRYHDSGHLLGAAMIEVEVRESDTPVRLLFSGDVGRYNAPLYHDPAPPPACDYLICESTYGDRDHPPGAVLDQLAEVVQAAIRRGGVLVVASFAVGRTQQLIFLLRALIEQGRLPEIPIYIDSPMAINATSIYTAHRADHDLSEFELTSNRSVLDGHEVHLARSVQESKRLNSLRGPAVIISSPGMMTGGRILHHLKFRLPDARNTILAGGFMAAGTRGRDLQEGRRTIRIHGQDVPVRAAVASMSGLSGHADRSELLKWLRPLPPPKRVFLTHGELPAARALAQELRASRGWNTHVPKMGESVILESQS